MLYTNMADYKFVKTIHYKAQIPEMDEPNRTNYFASKFISAFKCINLSNF